jgi:hypothetical protein
VLRRTLQWLLCSVSGTAQNTADWLLCSVSGTVQNTADWLLCSVSGTAQGTADWLLCSVSGTARDTADWLLCSVSGTAQNTADWLLCSVPGTAQGTADWLFCSVSGTARDTADWLLCLVSGTAQDTSVAPMFSIWYCAGHCSGSHVHFTNICTVQLPHCRTTVLYLLHSSICCRRYEVSLLVLGNSTQYLCQFEPYPSQKRHFLSTTKTNLSFLFRAVGTAYCDKMNMQDEFLNCAFPKFCQLATYLILTTLTVAIFCKAVILWDATLGQQVCASDVGWKISSQTLEDKDVSFLRTVGANGPSEAAAHSRR